MSLFGPPSVDRLKAKRDTRRLIALLSHPKVALRVQAAQALGELADVVAIDPLLNLLNEPNMVVAQALDKCGWRPTKDITSFFYYASKNDYAGCARIGAIAVSPMVDFIENNRLFPSGSEMRKALSSIDDPAAVDSLIPLLNHPRWDIASPSAEALSRIGSQPAILGLVSAVKESVATAFVPLARTKAAQAFDTIVAQMHIPKVRLVAIKALGVLGDPRALEHVLRFYDPALTAGTVTRPKGGKALDDYFDLCRAIDEIISQFAWQPTRDRIGALYLLEHKKWEQVADFGVPALKVLLEADQASLFVSLGQEILNNFRNTITATIAAMPIHEKIETVPILVAHSRQDLLELLGRDPSPDLRRAVISVVDDIEIVYNALSDSSPLTIAAATEALQRIKTQIIKSASDLSAVRLHFLLHVDHRDPLLASALSPEIARLREECGGEDTSHGGFTLWQRYSPWIIAAEAYIQRH